MTLYFEHKNGSDAEGASLGIAPALKTTVNSDGRFEVDEDRLEESLRRTDVDQDEVIERLEQAGHEYLGDEPVQDEEKTEDKQEESSEEKDESSEEEVSESDGSDEETEAEDEQDDEASTKDELLEVDHRDLQGIASEFDDVDGSQSHEDLAEDLAGRVKLEEEE